MLPEKLSPLLERVVAHNLHVLPHPRHVLRACAEQLNETSLEKFIAAQNQRLTNPATDDGFFELLPREVLLNIFSYLDVVSLVRVSAVCSSFRHVVRDTWLYTHVDLRQVFHCVSSDTLRCRVQSLDTY